MLKFTIKTSMHLLLHVSVHLDHPQETYGDPCWSYTFVELSVKYIVKSFAGLWQRVWGCCVCIECCADTLRGTRYTQQTETHVVTTLQNFNPLAYTAGCETG
jgi:hypothetical protein